MHQLKKSCKTSDKQQAVPKFIFVSGQITAKLQSIQQTVKVLLDQLEDARGVISNDSSFFKVESALGKAVETVESKLQKRIRDASASLSQINVDSTESYSSDDSFDHESGIPFTSNSKSSMIQHVTYKHVYITHAEIQSRPLPNVPIQEETQPNEDEEEIYEKLPATTQDRSGHCEHVRHPGAEPVDVIAQNEVTPDLQHSMNDQPAKPYSKDSKTEQPPLETSNNRDENDATGTYVRLYTVKHPEDGCNVESDLGRSKDAYIPA